MIYHPNIIMQGCRKLGGERIFYIIHVPLRKKINYNAVSPAPRSCNAVINVSCHQQVGQGSTHLGVRGQGGSFLSPLLVERVYSLWTMVVSQLSHTLCAKKKRRKGYIARARAFHCKGCGLRH